MGMSLNYFLACFCSCRSVSQAYATVLYDDFTPEVATQHAIVRVNGNVRPADFCLFLPDGITACQRWFAVNIVYVHRTVQPFRLRPRLCLCPKIVCFEWRPYQQPRTFRAGVQRWEHVDSLLQRQGAGALIRACYIRQAQLVRIAALCVYVWLPLLYTLVGRNLSHPFPHISDFFLEPRLALFETTRMAEGTFVLQNRTNFRSEPVRLSLRELQRSRCWGSLSFFLSMHSPFATLRLDALLVERGHYLTVTSPFVRRLSLRRPLLTG